MPRLARLTVLACLLGAALLPVTVAAQEAPALERVEVALWPEYDQRAMLVIYRVTVPAGTPLPAEVTVPIPARVGEPGAVAQQGGDGALVLADYALGAAVGEWVPLTIQAESLRLQVEFYDALSIEGDQRAYALTWPAGWPVGELAFEVQQPFGVDSMEIDPAPLGERVGGDGLTYYTGTLGSRDGSAEAEVRVGYTSSGSGLTAEALSGANPAAEPAISAAEGPEPASLWLEWAPWLIGGLGVILLVGAGVVFLRTRRVADEVRRPRHRPRAEGEAGSPGIDASAVFCHSCGTRASVSDMFCRKCGTRLRS